jgi:TonB-dependent receptor
VNDEWTLMADISYSKAERDQFQPEVNAQFAGTGGVPANQYDNGAFALNGGDDMPSLTFDRTDYADPDVILVGPTIYGSGYAKLPHTEDELASYRVDMNRTADAWWFTSYGFGINYSDRSKDKETPESALSTLSGGTIRIADQFLLSPMDLGYANAGQALAWDVYGVLDEYFNPIAWGTPDQAGYSYLAGKFWTVEEKVTTAFVRGELSHDLSDSVTLKGNVGLQFIYTDQSSSSFRVDTSQGNAVYGVEDGKTYDDVLPQLNFAFILPDSQAIRVGIAKEMARARMDQLKATEESGYNFTTGEPGGSAGNPLLDPWRAWAFDLSWEKYFAGNKGYVSAATFYKDLESYIYTQTTEQEFTELYATTPDELFCADPNVPSSCVEKQLVGRISKPVNGDGGYLWGLEFSASLPFEMFAEALDGFGAIVSYSYTDSDIEIQGSISSVATDSIPLPGLSQDVWNATLYYEKYGFGARIATRYRSEYIGEVSNFANDRALRFVQDDMITDAQLSYLFSEGMLDGLQILFQVNNLTNEPYVAYSEDEERLLDYQEYGTQYLLGLNYRF